MEPAYHSFEDLFIWKEGLNLSIDTYTLMKNCRDFGLKDQMQRCSVSVPSNIAEGFELHTNRAFIRHLIYCKRVRWRIKNPIIYSYTARLH